MYRLNYLAAVVFVLPSDISRRSIRVRRHPILGASVRLSAQVGAATGVTEEEGQCSSIFFLFTFIEYTPPCAAFGDLFHPSIVKSTLSTYGVDVLHRGGLCEKFQIR